MNTKQNKLESFGTCHTCEKTFETVETWNAHCYKGCEPPEGKGKYCECMHCGEQFDEVKAFNAHLPCHLTTKQLTYPTIESQKQFWIDKEAQSDNATNETRDVQLKAITKALWDYHNALDTCKHGGIAASELADAVEIALGKPWIRGATINVAYNPQIRQSTTADPKPKMEPLAGDDLDKIEATCDWYDHERNDFDRGDLRDEGRNPDGEGESYAARNV